jgi:hypothetical protein
MSGPALTLAGAELVLDPAGAVWLPAAGTLVVADLHLETGSAYARRGTLLPPYDSQATLARLAAVVRAYRPATIVSLGDGFHDRQGAASLSPAAFDALGGLVGGTRFVWVTGNHDPAPPTALGGAVAADLDLAGLRLRHIPARAYGPEIAGHMHPKARIAGSRLRVSRPCFVTDGTRLVLPAFGSLTGGLNALDPALAGLFPGPFDAWLVGERRVFRVPAAQLLPEPPMYRSDYPPLIGDS